nr:hypothetical protein [Tanacetum cinerariifolium]
NHLMCMSYTDVAQVANAARKYEIIHERDDDDAERPDKRRVVIGISRLLNRVVTGTTVIITTVMDQTGEVVMITIAATTITLATTTGIPVIDVTRETGVSSLTDLLILWGLHRSTLNHLMCMSYTDVAQVANAARNYEILHERDDDDTERPDKRQKSGDRHQPTSQQSSHRSHGHHNDRHGSDRRGGSDNHRSSNNNYSGSNNRNSGYGRDKRNKGSQHRPLSRVVTGATVEITTVRDLTGVVAMTTTAATITTTTLAVTTGIPAMDVTKETGVISPTDLPILALSNLGVPLRVTPTQYALLVDVDTKESVVKLQ